MPQAPEASSSMETCWLQPGQPQWVWMERGAHLLVQRGSVEMVLPQAWWADAMPLTTITLPAGTAHVMGRGGRVRLQAAASRSAEVLCIAPAKPLRYGLAAWWARVSAGVIP